MVRSGVNILLTIPLRVKRKKNEKPRIVFYDQMNGNVKAFVDFLERHKNKYEFYYLAYPEYHRSFPIEHSFVRPLSPLRLRDVMKVVQADVVITNYGLQTMLLILKLTNIKFVDVWHGIPYKGFTPSDFFFLNDYEEVWVSSESVKEMYKKQYMVPEEKVVPTGYARVDPLVNNSYSRDILRKKYNISSEYNKIICIAPTWKQDDKGRNIIPFDVSEEEFISRLKKVAEKHNSLLIFRAHRGSGSGVQSASVNNLRVMPGSVYPDTEEILYLSDILVTDWSSIAFDYLPLRRPTIFLDIAPPFKHGLSLGREHRFGELANSLNGLCDSIDKYLDKPEDFLREYSKSINHTIEVAYGDTLDGKSANRYHHRLKAMLSEE